MINTIAKSFDRAAENYDKHCHIQRMAAKNLANKIQFFSDKNYVLDIGSGSGNIFKFLNKKYRKKSIFIEFDLSIKMLVLSKKNGNSRYYVCGNMFELPFKTSIFDIITISFAEHWVYNESCVLFEEINRILKPGGELYLCLILKNSLVEMDASLSTAGKKNVIISFKSLYQYINLLNKNSLFIEKIELRKDKEFFQNFIQSLKSIKNIGSISVKKTSFTKKNIKTMNEFFENFFKSVSGTGYITWNTSYITARKINI